MENNLQLQYSTFYGENSAINYVCRRYQLELLDRGGSLLSHHQQQVLVLDKKEAVLDRLCCLHGWSIYRFDADRMVGHSSDAVVRATACVRGPRTACTVEVWATDAQARKTALDEIQRCLGHTSAARSAMINWAYFDTTLRIKSIEETIEDSIHESAYPWLPQGVDGLTRQLLDTEESVLVLYGPPGVGKTRLIRHLIASMGERRDKRAEVLYTADTRVMASDEIFMNFMTGDYDAMVVEDADHLLEPRTDGNQNLHRLLAASDGLMRPHGRRLIFSTNLPSKLDIDEALLRPGRCIGCLAGRKLSLAEADVLLGDLGVAPPQRSMTVQEWREAKLDRLSLAEVYATTRRLNTHDGQELPEAA